MREFLVTLLVCSASMSMLGLLYMAVTPLLARRYSAKSRYYAWLMIVIGLIVPFRPHFGGAIVTYDLPPAVVYPIAEQSNAVMAITPTEMAAPAETFAPSDVTAPSVATPGVSLWQIAALAWIIGMIAFVANHTVKHLRFSKMAARWSENVTNEQALLVLENVKWETGITRDIGLLQCPNVGSPTLIGIANPRILLPRADFTPDELAFILRHELTHYRRGDLWYKCAALLAVAIHWFNPIVYFLAKAIDAACELSCDAETVRNADVGALQRYCETIIGVVRYQSKLKTALSTTFYGGKRGMKKRIYSIMDTGKKKTSAGILCCLLLLTIGTGMAFATSTSEQKNTPLYQRNGQVNAQESAAETDQSLMSRFDPETGKTSYSFDLGKTWVLLTDEEYDALFPSPVIQWWTYDEYKAWMEEQVDALQALADDGQPAYYDKEGTLRSFTQADVEEATALYQSILENIKNGYRVSKTVDGSAETVVFFDPQNIAPNATETYAVSSDSGQTESDRGYDQYGLYGLAYDKKTDDFYYNGELVRRFYDERTSSTVTRTLNPMGIVDVTAIRNDKYELIGLYKHSQQEFDERTKAMAENTAGSVTTQYAVASSDGNNEFTYDYSKYAPYGLRYDAASGTLYYKSQRVRHFEDSYPLGENMSSNLAHFDDEGTIDVHAVRDLTKIVYNSDGSYDPSGVLIGVEPDSQAAFNARGFAWYEEESGSMVSMTQSIVEDVPRYGQFDFGYDSGTSVSYFDSTADQTLVSASASVHETARNEASYSAASTFIVGDVQGASEAEGQTFEQLFAKYEAFGITFNPNSANGGLGNVYYHGKLVATFIDINPSGGVISFTSSDGGNITVRTVYDENGELSGLEVAGTSH